VDWQCNYCNNYQGKERYVYKSCRHCNRQLESAYCEHCHREFRL
jgi:hypothetical protein